MFIKYNSKLKEISRDLRKNQTASEKEMDKFLKQNYRNFRFLKQKPLNGFIVDFYCSKLNLIIEIDGEIHDSQKERDAERDNLFFIKHEVKTVRFLNSEVENRKEYVKETLDRYIKLVG